MASAYGRKVDVCSRPIADIPDEPRYLETEKTMNFDSYRYRVVVDWIDPENGQPRQTEFQAHQFSAGKAGRIMATQTDGRSFNFSHFVSARLERITEPKTN